MVSDSSTRGINHPPFNYDISTGQRRPNILHPDPALSGDGVQPLTWPQQNRLLHTIRVNADFRLELLVALGLETPRRRRP